MALLKDLGDFDTNGQKGDWCFLNNDTYIAIQLGDIKLIDTCVLPIAEDRPISWKWNGSKESPTLTPSILHWGNGRDRPATWHGYLTDGELVTV